MLMGKLKNKRRYMHNATDITTDATTTSGAKGTKMKLSGNV